MNGFNKDKITMKTKTNQYRDLVFRYIDRMIDPSDSDPLEGIVDEFYEDFLELPEVKSMMAAIESVQFEGDD